MFFSIQVSQIGFHRYVSPNVSGRFVGAITNILDVLAEEIGRLQNKRGKSVG
jgi:hypothetical protein